MNVFELHKRCFLRPMSWEAVDNADLQRLGKHCRDSFLRTLQALKDEHEERVGADECHGTGTHCLTCKLIRELEEVA